MDLYTCLWLSLFRLQFDKGSACLKFITLGSYLPTYIVFVVEALLSYDTVDMGFIQKTRDDIRVTRWQTLFW